jgi:tRNA dimethylallyltransferase
MAKPDLICLMGPTAAGKTGLAVELVKQHPLEIISVDSAQVYQQMDVGSAKPDAETLALAPHRLIDFRNPAEAYSAALFCTDAKREILEIQGAGKTPLLVGGTLLYFRALLEGMSELPAAHPPTRAKIIAEAEEQGWQALHDQLAEIDPESALRIHPNDPQRLQRALEVYRLSGKTMTELQQHTSGGLREEFNVIKIALIPEDRSLLHARIERRFHQMLAEGLVKEVETLYRRGDLNDVLPAMRSVGYRQVWQHLAGELTYDEMIDKGIVATRQLAKRQLTWLRSEHADIVLDPFRQNLKEQIARINENFLKLH